MGTLAFLLHRGERRQPDSFSCTFLFSLSSSFFFIFLFCKSLLVVNPLLPLLALTPSFSSFLPIFVSLLHFYVLFFIVVSPLNLSLSSIKSHNCSHSHYFSLFLHWPLSLAVCLLSFFLNRPLFITSLVFCQDSKTNLLWFTVLKALFPPVSVFMHQSDKEVCLGQGQESVHVGVVVCQTLWLSIYSIRHRGHLNSAVYHSRRNSFLT